MSVTEDHDGGYHDGIVTVSMCPEITTNIGYFSTISAKCKRSESWLISMCVLSSLKIKDIFNN